MMLVTWRGALLRPAALRSAWAAAAAAARRAPPQQHQRRAAAARAAAQPPPPPDRPLVVLGIESSCDDTAAAVVASDGRVLGEAIAGQAAIHAAFGGVHPSAAAAAHAAAIESVVAEALARAGAAAGDLSAVAVTVGPGLSLCLDVGVRKARALSREAGLPLVAVHHMEAHALVARLAAAAAAADAAGGGGAGAAGAAAPGGVAFPFLCLLVSGGHNLLVLARGVGDYLQLGSTLDDALGEAYDKVARMLGLKLEPHGGAVLEALARGGDPGRYALPVPMQRHPNCDFSFAGLKTGVRLCIERELPPEGHPDREQIAADIAASFQSVAVTHLCQRVRRGIGWARDALAAQDSAGSDSSSSGGGSDAGGSSSGNSSNSSNSSSSSNGRGGDCSGSGRDGSGALRQLVVAGGVASNAVVRQRLGELAAEAGLELVVPPPRWCTDNGVMVAWAGIERMRLGLFEPALPPLQLEPGQEQEWIDLRPRWPLTTEKAAGSTPRVRSSKAAASLARSLTEETREALGLAPAGEGPAAEAPIAAGAAAPPAAAAAVGAERPAV
ncbi:hypothetical protein Rsub_03895 [Raphidocelis subcapitata]|uniref:Glycoprotease 1 n=1 Tax=Raphidocelis subcapitata TaxID=307507 RepID=A0A2V0NUM7_9CHLO|nr:hypothetical protein Rsub_03895 [Raphidocelis subcapitata]|eukprot:GBF91039.1 hypothetical protein Rsub_03895 [Raphidocelis subcapitata]